MRRGKTLAAPLVLLVLGAVGAVGQEKDSGGSPGVTREEIRARVEAPLPHPRLLVDAAGFAALRRSADGDPLRRRLAGAIIAEAERLLDQEPIARTLEGRRLLGPSRRCVERVLALALACRLTGDDRFAARAEREMLAAARFQDWNPSHFLDVAEMTFALAVGFDWLHDRMDEAARDEIRAAIVEKGVSLPFTTRHAGWVRSTNNWGQVCHGGLVAGALAVMEDEPELAARTVLNALDNVTRSMAVYAPNGSYPEGPAYWAYGTGYNVLLIAALESALGTDFGLSRAPGFDRTGAYPALACGPSGLFFNYADGGAGRGPEPFRYWFAARYDRPDWLLGERSLLEALLAREGVLRGGRFLPLTLLWMRDVPTDLQIDLPLHWSGEGAVPVTIHRSSWTDPRATFVGFKGGSPAANHGQMDTGSFVLDADGERWALDLGAEGYHGIESRGMDLWNRRQDSDRWTIFRQRNHGHNTLVIDDQLQRAAGAGVFRCFSADPRFPCSVLDLTPVYAEQADRVHRGVALLPSREVLIQDELEGLPPGVRVRFGMITPAEPGAPGQRVLTLRQKDASLTLEILAPADAAWTLIDVATPANEWDSPNPGTRMVAFEVAAPTSGALTLAVLASPGSCEESARNDLEARPLACWGR